MRTGTRGAAGWSRVLSLAVLLFASPAFGLGGITDPQVDPRAANAIQSFKLDFSYASDLAFTTARTTACAKRGIKCDAIQEGMIYYRTTDNVIRYYDGAAWQTYAPAAGAGLTLDDVYTAGQSITRDLLPVTVTDGTVGATSTFVLNRTAGTGAVLDLSNAGTGNDITGDLWSVSTAGEIVAVGFTLGDDQSVNFGAATDAIILWDTTGTDHLEFSALVDSTEVHWDEDQHGLDQKWWGDTATAGDGMFYDASAVELSFLKTAAAAAAKILLGYDDILSLGDSSEFTLMYDDDTTATYMIGKAGEEIYVGADGTGLDVVIYSDTAGSSAQFTYASDSLVLTNYTIGMGDDDQIKFGATDDATIEWVNASGLLKIGAAGGTPVHFGVANAGLDVNFFDNGAPGAESLTWDAIDAVTNDARLEFVHADAYFDDNSRIILGTGAANNGDVAIAFETSAAFPAADVLHIKPAAGAEAADQIVQFGTDGAVNNVNVYFTSGTAGDGLMWNNSMTSLMFTDATAAFGDGADNSDAIIFGDDTDFSVYYDNADNALVFDPAGGGGNEINFGDEDSANYPDILWHAGPTMSVLYDEAAGNPVEYHDDVPIALDQDSALYFDPTSASTPVDGFGMKGDSSAASDKLYLYSLDGGTSGEFIVGYDGASFLSTDMTLWGSAGMESASLRWDASTSSLNFLNSTSNSWYANNAYIGWGNTQAAPGALVSFNGVELLFDSDVADYNVQFGTDQVNHKVSVRFGDSATKAITINGNDTSGKQIVYNTVQPVQRIYIPAASFGVGSVGTATWGKEDSAAGWTLDPSGTECVQTTWQPDLWVANPFNVRAVFTAGSSNNVVLTVSSVQVVPGTTASTDVDDPGVKKTLAVTDSVISETPTGDMWTVAGAKVDSSHWRPIVIEVCRVGGDGDDNLVGDLVFMGLEMEVPRSYGD